MKSLFDSTHGSTQPVFMSVHTLYWRSRKRRVFFSIGIRRLKFLFPKSRALTSDDSVQYQIIKISYSCSLVNPCVSSNVCTWRKSRCCLCNTDVNFAVARRLPLVSNWTFFAVMLYSCVTVPVPSEIFAIFKRNLIYGNWAFCTQFQVIITRSYQRASVQFRSWH